MTDLAKNFRVSSWIYSAIIGLPMNSLGLFVFAKVLFWRNGLRDLRLIINTWEHMDRHMHKYSYAERTIWKLSSYPLHQERFSFEISDLNWRWGIFKTQSFQMQRITSKWSCMKSNCWMTNSSEAKLRNYLTFDNLTEYHFIWK